MKTKNPTYLVRKRDYHIWELDPHNSCYRSYSTRDVTYPDGTRPHAQSHFTFENLTQNYEFFPITKDEIEKYEKLGKKYHEIWKKYHANDGHGGIKGSDYLTDAEREFIGLVL